MITRNEIKLVKSLKLKKNRDEQRLFVAEGRKCIEELMSAFSLEMLIDETNASVKDIEQMSSLRTPQGQIAVFHQPQSIMPSFEELESQLVLVLDDVQDPGNLGTIIRTADWFGVKHIICSNATADCFNPKVVQATMGALARVSIYYTDIADFLASYRQSLASNPIYGTLLEGENIYQAPLKQKGLVIMGNEGNGISREVKSYISDALFIPPYPQGATTVESLNVGVATAITLSAFRSKAYLCSLS